MEELLKAMRWGLEGPAFWSSGHGPMGAFVQTRIVCHMGDTHSHMYRLKPTGAHGMSPSAGRVGNQDVYGRMSRGRQCRLSTVAEHVRQVSRHRYRTPTQLAAGIGHSCLLPSVVCSRGAFDTWNHYCHRLHILVSLGPLGRRGKLIGFRIFTLW